MKLFYMLLSKTKKFKADASKVKSHFWQRKYSKLQQKFNAFLTSTVDKTYKI